MLLNRIAQCVIFMIFVLCFTYTLFASGGDSPRFGKHNTTQQAALVSGQASVQTGAKLIKDTFAELLALKAKQQTLIDEKDTAERNANQIQQDLDNLKRSTDTTIQTLKQQLSTQKDVLDNTFEALQAIEVQEMILRGLSDIDPLLPAPVFGPASTAMRASLDTIAKEFKKLP